MRKAPTGRSPTGASAFYVLIITAMVVGSTGLAAGLPSESGPWWFPTQGMWLETQNLEVDDPDDPRNFGSHVAIDGDTMITSTQFSRYHDQWFSCAANDGCDRVYVFERTVDGSWTQTAVLVPDDARPGDSFGFSLDLDESSGVIVVGNPGQDAKADQFYIFERQDDGSWDQTANIHRSYPDLPPDQTTVFGVTVAVSGHTVLATDVVEDEEWGDRWAGRTFVYEKVDGSWKETDKLPGGGAHRFIDISGDRAVTMGGSVEEFCENQLWDAISILVHERRDGEWSLAAAIFPEPSYEKMQSVPTRLALSEDGKMILVGAAVDRRVYGVHTEHCVYLDLPPPLGPLQAHTNSGAAGAVGSAWIFEEIRGDWVMTADIPNPLPNPGMVTGGSVFGAAVDISGPIAVIGAHGDFYEGGSFSGTAYVYEKILDKWVLQGRLRHHEMDSGEWFGATVGISGNTIVIGASAAGEHGKTYVYNRLVDLDPVDSADSRFPAWEEDREKRKGEAIHLP